MKRILLTVLLLCGCEEERGESRFKEFVAAPEKSVNWGFYQMLTRRHHWGDRIDEEARILGGEPRLTLFFRDLHAGRGYPKIPIQTAYDRGLRPIISLELTQWGQRGEVGFLEAIVAGEYDSFFRSWAAEAKRDGKLVYLRFGFEMNGDWFGWGQQPELFRQAWRRAHGIFEEEKAVQVKWMFSPNVLWGDKSFEKDIEPYWPGDDVVDVCGLDGYNFGDEHSEYHRWTSYEEVFESSLQAMGAFGKPLYISEIGCAADPRKAEWMRDFLEKVSVDERIEGFVYFHHNNPRKGEPNWRMDSDERSLAVFRAWSESAYGSASKLEP